MKMEIELPAGLHSDTCELVIEFANALAAKLRKAERRYGFDNGWKTQDWEKRCREDLHLHIGKGDPLDVAAYCAFMWKRGWPTA